MRWKPVYLNTFHLAGLPKHLPLGRFTKTPFTCPTSVNHQIFIMMITLTPYIYAHISWPRAIAWLFTNIVQLAIALFQYIHTCKTSTKGCFLVWRTNRRNANRNFFLALLQHLWHQLSKNTQRAWCNLRIAESIRIWSHLNSYHCESWIKNTRWYSHCGTAP